MDGKFQRLAKNAQKLEDPDTLKDFNLSRNENLGTIYTYNMLLNGTVFDLENKLKELHLKVLEWGLMINIGGKNRTKPIDWSMPKYYGQYLDKAEVVNRYKVLNLKSIDPPTVHREKLIAHINEDDHASHGTATLKHIMCMSKTGVIYRLHLYKRIGNKESAGAVFVRYGKEEAEMEAVDHITKNLSWVVSSITIPKNALVPDNIRTMAQPGDNNELYLKVEQTIKSGRDLKLIEFIKSDLGIRPDLCPIVNKKVISDCSDERKITL